LELDPILSSVKTLRYGEPVPLAGNTSAEFLDAGHIPGSASVMFTVQGPASRRLLFAGDLGNQHSDLVDGPKPAPAVNAIWLESTYGSRTRDGNVNEQKATFRRNVGLVTSAGGIAWIPAFALDRTQKILTQLQIARREGDLGALVPIFVGSPSGIAITEAYSSEFSRRSVERWFRPSLYTANQIFPPFTSAQPTPIPKPAVIVTSSGMLDLGLSSTLAHELLPRSDVTVFLVGYQDPASPGAQLQDGVKVVSVDGRTTQVTATVRRFSVFSAHADRADLAAWLANQELTTPVRLVHGDRDNLSALQRNLAASGFTAVQIAGP
jgi:metallo-beta-lactamase family protein